MTENATPTGLTQDEKTQGMLAHLLNGIFPLLGGLVIWLIGKDKSPFIDREGKEATNFGITVALAYVAGFIVVSIIAAVTLGLGAVLYPLLWLISIAALVFGIIGAMAANKGEHYRYPVNLRLIK